MTESLELPDEITDFAGGVEMAPAPVSAQLLAGGVGVVDQVSGDDEYRAGDRDECFGVSPAFDDALAAGGRYRCGRRRRRSVALRADPGCGLEDRLYLSALT
ncbi:hypothetical protein ACFW9L_16260 [Streptomyces sp. NPDC059517]|uniref:hypothetical protein n=1 Tax=Streptomyces sp. NPDC059517 TaxID=3346855 RepID=UPI00369EDD78